MEKVRIKATEQITKLREREVAVLARLLERQSLILGIKDHGDIGIEALVNTLRAADTVLSDANLDNKWLEIQQQCRDFRPVIWEQLLNRIGCMQGTGPTAYAIDPTLLALNDEDNLPAEFLERDIKSHRKIITDRLSSVVKKQVGIIEKLYQNIQKIIDFDGEFDLEVTEFEAALTKLEEALEPIAIWPYQITKHEFKEKLTQFSQLDLGEQLRRAQRLISDDVTNGDEELKIEILGQLDFAIIEAGESCLQTINSFLTSVEKELNNQSRALKGLDPASEAQALAGLLGDIERDLEELTSV